MKKWIMIAQLFAANVMAVTGYCQISGPVTANQATIVPQRLEVCLQKTTNLIFPAPIKSVDRGSNDVLVQKPTGVENVLKVKAGRQYFPETNLTVITADGQFYSFTVEYTNNPSQLVLQIRPGYSSINTYPVQKTETPAMFTNTANNESLIKSLEAQASITKRNIKHVQDKTYEMKAAVRGLYTSRDMFFYKVILTNESNIDYNVEAIRFIIEDKKKIKRTSSQEIPVDPISIVGDYRTISAHKEGMVIITVPKQTIAKDKRLLVEVVEKGGGRNMICTLNNKVLLKAKSINPIADNVVVTGRN